MATTTFDRDSMAQWYVGEHFLVDPGITEIHYLPTGAPDREIRFVEINNLIPQVRNDVLEPIDFGVDTGAGSEHKLLVLDVTPDQWNEIAQHRLALPAGWSRDGERVFGRRAP